MLRATKGRRIHGPLAMGAIALSVLGGVPGAASPREGLIVALGDSLTAGLGVPERDAWPSQVERRLRAEGYRWRVVNAGVSGETSSGARARLGQVLGLGPDVVVIATGANDGLRGLPPGALRANLDAMLAALDARGVAVVLAGMQSLGGLGPAYATAFARVYPEAALRHRAAFVPFLLEGVAGNPLLNQEDGLHPTADGHREIADLVYPAVLEAIRRVRSPAPRDVLR